MGGYLTYQGIFTIGSLVAYVSLLNVLINPLMWAYQLWVHSKSAWASFERVSAIFEEEQDSTGECLKKQGEYQYEIKNLYFSYEGGKEALTNINLNIKPGMKIAFVGMSGSGKSTLLKLLYGHYMSYEGEMKFYGNDVSSLLPSDLHEHIALISQQSYLFPISVKDNIRMGNRGASDEEIIQAAKMANSHDFIMDLPDGYNTVAGGEGMSLSGGQVQRLALARAILKQAEILLVRRVSKR